MPYPWFKFYGMEYLSDQKMLALNSHHRSCWMTLLSYASQYDGIVKNLTEEHLISQSGIALGSEEFEKTKGVFDLFVKLEMIRIDNGVITITNWKKRQQSSLTPYERVKKFREKKRDDNANDNDRRRIEEEEEKKEERKKKPKDETSALWNKSLFQKFKESGIEISNSENERIRYPRNMRQKNPDLDYWIKIAKFSQSYGFKQKSGEYVMPWKGAIKLSKLYYEAREKYDEQFSGQNNLKRLADMKKSFGKSNLPPCP